ncbi:multidrug and toxin extrusion protein 2-like [Oculina patagonica]
MFSGFNLRHGTYHAVVSGGSHVCQSPKGWTTESLQHWGQFIMLAVPGILMLCIEWWSFEVGTFLMGSFGTMQLATHGILMQYSSFMYMIPLGLSVAVSVRVRNALGKGDHIRAKHIMKVSIVTVCCFIAALSAIFIVLRENLGQAFTHNSEIVGLVSKVTPAMTGFSFFLSTQVICSGIIRGCGRHKLVFFINFIFHYCVALPLASSLAFYVFKSRVEGFWWGLAVGLALQSLAFIIILWWMDWDKYTKKARKRLAPQRPTSLLSWSTGNERGDEENLVVTWLSRTSSLFSVNTNSLREFTNPPNPVMSWIYRSSSLLSLNTTPLRAMNRDHEQVLLEGGPPGRDRSSVSRQQLGIHGNKMTSNEKWSLILRRLVWLIFALLVLLTAVIVRVTISLPSNESHTLTAGNMTGLLTNLTNFLS